MFKRIRKFVPWAVVVLVLFLIGSGVQSCLNTVIQYGDGGAAWIIIKDGDQFKVTVQMPNPVWATPTFTATKKVKTVAEGEMFARNVLTANIVTENGVHLSTYINSLEAKVRTSATTVTTVCIDNPLVSQAKADK